jgi:hypothetical protein
LRYESRYAGQSSADSFFYLFLAKRSDFSPEGSMATDHVTMSIHIEMSGKHETGEISQKSRIPLSLGAIL